MNKVKANAKAATNPSKSSETSALGCARIAGSFARRSASALHQDSARKSSRSFLPATFGVLGIVRRPYPTISKEKAKRTHKCYAILNKALRCDNGISVQSTLNC